jgi:hypothetical protein|tara:strand:- start:1107 stop:1286 length:180 start_codon:yes stop_codon:yes gene_type:complete
MKDKEINAEIMALKSKLTGNLFDDMQTQQEIYELKKILKPEIVTNPEMDDDDECLSCGS